MKIKSEINNSYLGIENWMKNLHKDFDNQGSIIIDSRNQVRLIEVNNEKYVVKYFKRITKLNRYIYRFLRKSKGERAYNYATKLINIGIPTPESVGYLDIYKGLEIKKCYFISKFIDYDSVADLLAEDSINKVKILEDLAKFLYSIHKKGVFHNDLNLTNIMCKVEDGVTKFSLIDNNRMKFVKYTRRRAMRNMRRVKMSLVDYAVLMTEYAKVANQNEFKTIGVMVFYKNMNTIYRNIKRAIKNRIQSLKNKFRDSSNSFSTSNL